MGYYHLGKDKPNTWTKLIRVDRDTVHVITSDATATKTPQVYVRCHFCGEFTTVADKHKKSTVEPST